MNITQEYLKIFLFTAAISVTAFGILFSSGSYDTTKLDFESTISARVIQDMAYVIYSIHNTGTTHITSIQTDIDCCTGISAPTYYPIFPRNNTGQIASMMKFTDELLEGGDTIHVTFTVSDDVGNSMTIIEPVRLR